MQNTLRLALLLMAHTLCADTRVAGIFADHMVLQRDMPVPVWGTAPEQTPVTVTFGDQAVTTRSNASGVWRVTLSPLVANAQGQVLTVTGDTTTRFNDVVVGEVWLASGQSNMAMKLKECTARWPQAKNLLHTARFPGIRFRRIDDAPKPTPQSDLATASPWVRCTPETAGDFSAVAFVYAHALHRELGIPMGMIDSSWGGKPIESFIPRKAFTGHPTLEALGRLADGNAVAGVKALEGGTFARDETWLASRIYNGRIAPTAPFAVRGAIWYQAESNCGRGEDPRHYQHKMRALIDGWRSIWNQTRFPVYFVQLPSYPAYGWAFMRDEQRRALAVADTGMAVTHDLTADGIHPTNKIDVGERLARWSLAGVYGKDIPYSGPLYRSHTVQGATVIVSFDHVDAGLMSGAKTDLHPTRATPEIPLYGFEVADAEGRWVPASARITGSALHVSASAVPQPVAVRYAMQPTAPDGKTWNLYNRAGLPASPFCTNRSLMPWKDDTK